MLQLQFSQEAGEKRNPAYLYARQKELGSCGQFAVIEKKGVRNVYLIHWHNVMNKHIIDGFGGMFVAVGRYNRKPSPAVKLEKFVEYDSKTCRKTYGYDRPKDPIEAKKLLEELEAILLSE